MPLPNMKLIIEVVEGQQGEEGNRSVSGYVVTTKVVANDPVEMPHDSTNLPWLAVLFVVAIQSEIKRAFGDPRAVGTYIVPHGGQNPIGNVGEALKPDQPANDDFPDHVPGMED